MDAAERMYQDITITEEQRQQIEHAAYVACMNENTAAARLADFRRVLKIHHVSPEDIAPAQQPTETEKAPQAATQAAEGTDEKKEAETMTTTAEREALERINARQNAVNLFTHIGPEEIAAELAAMEAEQAAPAADPDAATLAAIAAIIAEADHMRSAYFFQPPNSASSRRAYEKRHTHEEITWTESGHTYTAAYDVSCSCANVYARGTYTRDGKKTTLTAIRNSYKRMSA